MIANGVKCEMNIYNPDIDATNWNTRVTAEILGSDGTNCVGAAPAGITVGTRDYNTNNNGYYFSNIDVSK